MLYMEESLSCELENTLTQRAVGIDILAVYFVIAANSSDMLL